ncbi:MAG: glycosyltransferase family 2 protein [Pseudoclavibacter sp.]
MSQAVTAIVVARNSARDLTRTLNAVAAQKRSVDRTVVVLAARTDDLRASARAASPDFIVTVEGGTPFGAAVDAAVSELTAHDGDPDGWLWLFDEGDAPDADALESLFGTVERSPSLAITGPKLVRADDEAVLAELGQTTDRHAETVHLHAGELDQGQFDDASDVLAVARNGMLVRVSTWSELAGFDAGLPDADDALDFATRAWLADGRVTVTPQARLRIPSRRGPSLRETRRARLHRVVASAPAAESVLRRIALIPAAIVGIVWSLVRKRPGRIGPDLAAAFAVAFGRTGVDASRGRFAATSTQPPRVVERLQVSRETLRREREIARDERRIANRDEHDRYSLVGTGGAWMLLAIAVASVALMMPMLGRGSLAGGGLLPLSATFVELWSNVGYGVRDVASGAFGVADPFALLLALLGSITFWNPSTSIVVLWVLAMPLAALTAWYLAARLTLRPWLRAFAGLGWALSPTLLVALADGRIQTVIVHILLPLLFFCALRGTRSWTGVAQAALVAAAVLACAPSLWPVLALLWIVALIAGGRRWHRQLFLAVPAAALFAPLAVAQWNRGRPLAVFADPGAPLATDTVSGAALALGLPDTSLGGWTAILADAGIGLDQALLLAACLLPVGMLAVLGLVLPAWRVAAWSLLFALVGLVWAAVTGNVSLTTLGPDAVPLSTGPAQSLMMFGLMGAALAGLAVGARATMAWSLVALVGIGVLSAPAAVSHLNGTARVGDGALSALPAIVAAQAQTDRTVATLIITPLADGSMRVRLDRGLGETLDEESTLRMTAPEFSDVDRRLAELAVEFLSTSTSSPTGEFHALGIGFVLVEPAEPGGGAAATRITTSLDTNATFQAAGETASGTVWSVVSSTVAPAEADVAAPLAVSNIDTWMGRGILIVLGIVVLASVLLALPTGAPPSRAELEREAVAARRRRLTIDRDDRDSARRFAVAAVDNEPAPGFTGGDDEGVRNGIV